MCVNPSEQPQLLLGHWDLSHRQSGKLVPSSSSSWSGLTVALTKGLSPYKPRGRRDSMEMNKVTPQTSWGQQNLIAKPSHNKEEKKTPGFDTGSIYKLQKTFKQQRYHQQKSGSRSWKAKSWCKLVLVLCALSSKIGQNSQGTSFPLTIQRIYFVCIKHKEVDAVTDPFVKVKPHRSSKTIKGLVMSWSNDF